MGWGHSGARFWARPCPRPIFGTRRPDTKSPPIPSPADEFGPSPHQGYSPPLVLGIFRWWVVGRWTSGARFLPPAAWDIPRAHGFCSHSLGQFRVRRTKLAPAPAPTKAIAHPSFWAFSAGGCRTGAFGGSFLGAVVSAAYFWHTEAVHKASAHSESGGRSWPQPPTKAIAHPSFWEFSAGGLWDGGLRALVFGNGCA